MKTAQLTSMTATITLVLQMLLALMVSITSPASVPQDTMESSVTWRLMSVSQTLVRIMELALI